KEPWRCEPSLPNATPKEPKPKRPSELDPSRHPSKDHVLFPWEADLTEIEWAVTTFVKKEHPAIFDQIVQLALEHSGLVAKPEDSNNPNQR
ncbi:MAG: hypothetical protein SGI92_30560, partial [Bryobacteraceae bacterium]|nr:hypothetical protein [Bryobacteraceae bacterium]